MNRITRFNPYQMPDDLILALNTGREKEQRFVQEIIDHNVEGGRPPQHILLYGPRGIGKSFFLRLLQVHLAKEEHLCFVLLPEEQRNVYQPADLIREIKNHLVEERLDVGISTWGSSDVEAWRTQVAALEAVWAAQGKPHLVVGLENVDLLFSKGGAFEKREDQFLLREFLTETPWLTLIATTLYPDLDTRYEDALFHFFAKHELRSWQEPQHEAYLRKRNDRAGKKTTRPSLAQLKSLIRFTGGSPRITVIMVDVLADYDVDSAAETLEKTIDELTPFYQDLLSRIPPKSRLLFDALIRGGEPCSQSALAARVGSTQNVISQSFAWLQNHGYLRVERPEGEKQKLYAVRDRLFAHYYRMRHILHDSGKSTLSVMSEFLTHFFTRVQLKERAAELYGRGEESMSRELMQITLEDTGINPEALTWKDDVNALMEALDLSEAEEIPKPASLEEAQVLVNRLRDLLAACTHCPAELDAVDFAHQVFGSIEGTLEQKIQLAKACLGGTLPAKQWFEYKKICEEEVQDWLRVAGKAFLALRDGLAKGDIILEFVDDEQLMQLKKENLDAYHVLIAIPDLEHMLASPTPETVIDVHRYLLQRAEVEGNHQSQVWNLGQIGWNLQKLGRHEESLASHREALALRIEEGDRHGQAWNLGRIGWNLQKLGRHEESLEAHREALALRIEEGDRNGQAWNLGRIGEELMYFGRHDESLEAHRKALQLRIEEGNQQSQVWNLARIGRELIYLGRHEEALASHRKALELCTEEGNRLEQARNLGRIGWNLHNLGRYEESLASHREALELCIEEGERDGQALNLDLIGRELMYLGRHEESLASHREALALWIEEGNREEQVRNLGQIAVNRLLLNQQAKVWQEVDEHRDVLGDLRYEMIKQLGDAVCFYERQKETAKAYATGRNILENLLKRKDTYEPSRSVEAFFIDLFGERADVTLIEDLLEAAADIFGEDIDLALEGIRGLVAYLKSGKAQNVLVKMAPETRKVVETLVEELEL